MWAVELSSCLDHNEVCIAKRVCKAWQAMLSQKGFENLNLEGKDKIGELLARFSESSAVASHVRHVSLRFCDQLEESDLKTLKKFRNLESVNLDYCQKISDEGIRELVRCAPRLRYVSLFWMPWLSGKAAGFLRGLDGLRVLNLSGLTHLTDKDVGELVRAAGRQLVSIDLTRIKSIGEASLGAIGETCSKLETLRMYSCERFTDAAISNLGKGCPELQVLDVCGAKSLTDEGIINIARGCRRLNTLNLTWCVNLTNRALEALAQCRFMCHLSLHGLKHLTDAGMNVLARGCPCMIVLDVNGCCNMRTRALEDLQRVFPNLQRLVAL